MFPNLQFIICFPEHVKSDSKIFHIFYVAPVCNPSLTGYWSFLEMTFLVVFYLVQCLFFLFYFLIFHRMIWSFPFEVASETLSYYYTSTAARSEKLPTAARINREHILVVQSYKGSQVDFFFPVPGFSHRLFLVTKWFWKPPKTSFTTCLLMYPTPKSTTLE